MIINLKEFESFPAKKTMIAEPGSIEIDFDSILDVKELTHKLDIHQSNDEYFCLGQIDAVVELECARCLKIFEARIDSKTDFIICAFDKFAKEKEIIDNEDYVYFEGGSHQADLTPIIQQALILGVSLQPLCDADCKGLCPGCGANLNNGNCRCQKDVIDPRWDELKKLSAHNNKEGL